MQLALEKKERLSPSPCMHAASIGGEGKFCLGRKFSKDAPYKQKIIFHLLTSDKISQKYFFSWTVDQWYPFYVAQGGVSHHLGSKLIDLLNHVTFPEKFLPHSAVAHFMASLFGCPQ